MPENKIINQESEQIPEIRKHSNERNAQRKMERSISGVKITNSSFAKDQK